MHLHRWVTELSYKGMYIFLLWNIMKVENAKASSKNKQQHIRVIRFRFRIITNIAYYEKETFSTWKYFLWRSKTGLLFWNFKNSNDIILVIWLVVLISLIAVGPGRCNDALFDWCLMYCLDYFSFSFISSFSKFVVV